MTILSADMQGRATALQFVKDGCTRLVLTDIIEETLNETVRLIKDINSDVEIEAIVGDLNSEEFVEQMVSETVESFGSLNYAVNAAGISGKSIATDELDFEEYRRVQSINMEALWFCERAELRAMLAQEPVNGYLNRHVPLITNRVRGSIVNVSSVLGIRGAPRAVPYVVSKHAIVGLTKADACTYASQGIRVNCVSPGYSCQTA